MEENNRLEILDENLENVMNGLLNSLTEENKVSLIALDDSINNILDLINLKDPEDFSYLIMLELGDVLTAIVNRLNPEIKDHNKIEKLSFIYKEYFFLNQHIENLISSREGGACCTDKSRWIIDCYQDYIKDGTTYEMREEKKEFWIPRFGTGQQWMNFCDSLFDFYYGRPEKYLKQIKDLISDPLKEFQ